MRYVIGHCRDPLYALHEDQNDAGRVLFLGPDPEGVPLEIVAIETDDGGLVVIHAMRLRRRYREDYRRVLRGQP